MCRSVIESYSDFRINYEDFIKKFYGIECYNLEDKIEREVEALKGTLIKSSSLGHFKNLNLDGLIVEMKKKVSKEVRVPKHEKLYVNSMPEQLSRRYNVMTYFPNAEISKGYTSGILWVDFSSLPNHSVDTIKLMLAHETYLGHHLHYTTIASSKIPLVFKIPFFNKASPLIEGIGVCGEYLWAKWNATLSVFYERRLIDALRAKGDIMHHKYSTRHEDIRRDFPQWAFFEEMSSIFPGYWLCHLIGFKEILNFSSKFNSIKEAYINVLNKGFISLNLLKDSIDV